MIVVDSNTIQLASSLAMRTGTQLTLAGDGTGGRSRAQRAMAGRGDDCEHRADRCSTTESATDGSLTLGETLNDATTNANSPYGP